MLKDRIVEETRERREQYTASLQVELGRREKAAARKDGEPSVLTQASSPEINSNSGES
jgi:hypothetical protein